MYRWVLAVIAIGLGSIAAYAQIINPGGGGGTPGGSNTQLQFNTNSTFGGISGITSDSANVGFATSSNLILYSQTPGLCLTVDANFNVISQSCAAGTSTGIAAGSNITTSGTAVNVTVNVVATPSFTTVIASGNVTAGTAQFTGQVTGTSAVFQTITDAGITGCLQTGAGGLLTGTGVNCATQTSTPSIAAGTNITTSGTAANTTINVVATPSFTTVIATGNLTGSTAQFSGLLTGTNAVFQTLTISNLTPTGPNCLQETGGVLQATNVSCATQVATISIAAGNNITTSGTTSNITVTATPTGASNTVQFNNAGVFGGDSGFQYAGGTSGIVTHTLGNVTTTNARALSIIGTLSSSIVVFDAPLFANITTNAFAVGSKLVDIQATTISVFGVSPSGSINSGALQSAATQCLQASTGGLIFGTAVPCATQVSTPSIAAGSNITTSGTAANTTVNVVATPSFTTVIATGNLTAGSAQFAGFLTAGGASLSGLTIQTATFSSNLTGTTANFSSNLTAGTAQFTGLATGTTATFQTYTGVNANLTGDITATRGQFTTVTGQNFATQTAGLVPSPSSIGAGQAFLRADGSWSTPSTLALNASTVTTPAGWVNYNGVTRTTADVGFTTTTVFVNLMQVNVVAGRTYKFDAEMPLKTAASSATIAFRIGGGATATAITYDGWVVDSGINGIKGNQQATALSTTVAGTVLTGTTAHATVIGTITVNAAGSLILQGAAFASGTAATQSTVSRGASFIVEDIP